jgi:hypothetical protein
MRDFKPLRRIGCRRSVQTWVLYVCMKTRTTPIATTKTQALARVLTAVTHGYTRACTGTVPSEKFVGLATKFDAVCRIANTKGQRIINRRKGFANTLFAAYNPCR